MDFRGAKAGSGFNPHQTPVTDQQNRPHLLVGIREKKQRFEVIRGVQCISLSYLQLLNFTTFHFQGKKVFLCSTQTLLSKN
eukprot:COSAG02_NODE_46337_length_349_cov_6.796000_1_plen_80_part_10